MVCVPVTSNLKWAEAPGNVLLPRSETGLEQDSVANVSLIIVLDKQQLTERDEFSQLVTRGLALTQPSGEKWIFKAPAERISLLLTP